VIGEGGENRRGDRRRRGEYEVGFFRF